MAVKIRIFLILIGILFVAGVFRLWHLSSVPPGLNVDEVSEGYNAYSLLKTGKDRYGMVMPIIFKSFGSYQPPIYTYLTILPTFLLGSGILSVKLVSVFSGLVVVLFTFLIIKEFFVKGKNLPAIFASLVVALSPWAIFFSRMATEASVGLAILVVGFYFLLKSVERVEYFSLSALFLGLATHAYYSERIIVVLLLAGFVLINRNVFFKIRKWTAVGLIIFGITMLPHLFILKSGAFTRRLDQVTYFNRNVPVVREFMSQYTAYFSPRSLFFDPDDQEARSMPGLSVFYSWMIIPYFLGFAYVLKRRRDKFIGNLLLLMLIAPIPAALTTDPFYTLRVFVLLWTLSIVISIGIWQIFEKIRPGILKYGLFTFLFVASLATFCTHYFILYKFERSRTISYPDMKLIEITKMSPNRNFVVDLSRDISNGMRFAYFRQYDPSAFQKEIGSQFLDKYYTSIDYEKEYKIDNVEIRPIVWEEDVFKDQIIVGDTLAISQTQADEHMLKLEFEIKDMAGNIVLRGYSTSPKEKCFSSGYKSIYCKKWL